CKYISQFDEIGNYYKNDSNIFNILFPHWNYEYELYPRPKMIKRSAELIKNWDLIFGHHPHVVQPITQNNLNGINKIIAYSGGNFVSGYYRSAHRYGLVMKCEIGKLKSDPSKYAVGDVHWEFCHTESDGYIKFKKTILKPIAGPFMKVRIDAENDYFPNLDV
ncbi:MAG: CapA family protein, partial [Candidatus Hermodarchaeota archaeon]